MDWIFDRNTGARISDKLKYRNWRVVVLENEYIRIVIIPEKGGDIVSFFNKKISCECLLNQIREFPDSTYDPNCSTKEFQGGNCIWPEMFPVASAYGDYFGIAQPFHGEAHMLPWRYDIIKDEPDEVVVRLTVNMQLTPFTLVRTMSLQAGQQRVKFDEKIMNNSEISLPIIWGHHPTFGKPFLSEDCRIYLPEGKFLDGDTSMLKIQPEGSGIENMFYLLDFNAGWYGIYNHRLKFGFGMRWDKSIFRVIWLWQSFNSGKDAPFFGRRYTAAIEPVSSLPQTAQEPKEPMPLIIKPNQTIETSLEAFLFDNPAQLTKKQI